MSINIFCPFKSCYFAANGTEAVAVASGSSSSKDEKEEGGNDEKVIFDQKTIGWDMFNKCFTSVVNITARE